jgi:flagellar export protein FliJ
MIQLRRQNRDECRRQLDEAERAEAILTDQIAAADAQAASNAQMRRRVASNGSCDLNLLLAAQRHQAALEQERQALSQQIGLVAREVERRRATLVEAEQQVRMMERLSERKQAESRCKALQQESKRLDELARKRR